MVPGHFLPPILVPAQALPQVQHTVRGTLKLSFLEGEYDPVTGETVLSGDVTATYDPTSVRCDELRLDPGKSEGTARGNVLLTDPEGRVVCSRITFNWEAKTGEADDVELTADNVNIKAQRMSVRPGKWEIFNARGSLSESGKSPVAFLAESVSITPGGGGVARNVYLLVAGTKLGPVPRLAFSLNRRIKGFGLPSFANRRDKGFGISWAGGVPVGSHGVFSTFWETFPRREPGFGLQYAFSPLSQDATTLISPSGDLGERASNGWFDSVDVRTPDDEQSDLRDPRRSFAVGSFWNQSTQARPADSENVSKRIDLVAETGGPLMGMGAIGSVRLQSLRLNGESPWKERATLQGSLLAPPKTLAKNLGTHVRLDAFGSASKDGVYGWARAEAGVVYRPSPALSFGAAYVMGGDAGNAPFPFDPLVSDRALHARMDFKSGPYTFRYLAKYDVDLHKWYDREYEIALVAKEFEPFIAYRQFPSETRIGIRFRIDNLRDRLMRRNQQRGTARKPGP